MEEKTMASDISVEENPFTRLPEELIISIFDKISDAKCLCICSSVSKSFAALVLKTRVLFVKMPKGLDACNCHPDPALAAAASRQPRLVLSLRNISYSLLKPIRVLWSRLTFPFRLGDEPDLLIQDIMSYLKKFSCIHSITIHFPVGNNSRPRFEPLLRWKYGSSGFIFVSATNRIAWTDENTRDSSVQTANDVTREEIIISLSVTALHLIDSILRVVNIWNIVDNLPNIKHVAATDDMKQGRVVFHEEEIAGIREKSLSPLTHTFFLKLWRAPSVKLPRSGHIMEEVSLILMRNIDGCDASEAENSFEEEEYRELVMVLVKEEPCFQRIASLSNMLGD